ncbi:hypothetical protein [Sorangium sp. So ce363]|uniref:hypothetical protein n=1 Tax=Sorangium sp. So ce363 TaxID=3133304 RepID=UPI003F607989
MPEGVQAVVLCEDLQAWVFVRRMLIALNYDAHRIRVIPYPAEGRGSGEQHVRERYADELGRHRARASRTKAVLVVHVDADRLTVQERHATLEQELQAQAVAPRTSDEAVAVLVPKREIETWIYFFLNGPPVDEQTSYPKLERQSEAWPSAEAFAAQIHAANQPAGAPPSRLVEARRIP